MGVELRDTVALVTGASSGMGTATAVSSPRGRSPAGAARGPVEGRMSE
jgi:NADP-dependent 3-hydroxy acid dehydrogenase YdfG